MTSIAQVIPAAIPSRGEALRRVAEAVRSSAAALEVSAAALQLLAEEPEPAPAGPDDMLTVGEAAKELRRSAAHVRAKCRAGAIKALRDAHGYRIRRSALLIYERKRTGASTSLMTDSRRA